MHTNTTVAIKPNFMSSLCYVFFKYAYSSITLKILNPHDKNPKRFAFHIFRPKCCLHHIIHFKAVQDDISAETALIASQCTCNRRY